MNKKELSTILSEIEDVIWGHEADHPTERLNYSVFGFRGGIKIFMSVLMDKMWEKMERDMVPLPERLTLAEETGNRIRELVKELTDVDTRDLYKI